ncbi:MAG: lipid-A-disaccharide synthase [Gammaproteobacteria bacterium]|nr:lipid-A-disaccharide synthase [Gammaproteobacteria bacterium]
MMRIGVVAGEASGDLLGAGLVKALKQRFPDAEITGIAGPKMMAAGCKTLFPMEQLSVMGLVEVLAHLPQLLSIRSKLFQYFKMNPPDVFIGIDAPDFNLGLERRLKSIGIPTVHYVSPSVWAWRQYRVKKIARSVDLMLTLFPFEVDFYRKHNVDACFIGHPLADEIPESSDQNEAKRLLSINSEAKVLALLPGSRMSEIEALAADFIAAAECCIQHHPDLKIVVPFTNEKTRRCFQEKLSGSENQSRFILLDGQSQLAMTAADAVLIASGTATLECLLIGRPMVIAYRLAPFTYWLARRLIRTNFYSLPNLLAGRMIVQEITQDEVCAETLAEALMPYLDSSQRRIELQQVFLGIHAALRNNASEAAVNRIVELLRNR